MTCHSKGAQSKGARSTQHINLTQSEIGVAFIRPDGKWSVSIGIQEPFVIKQDDLMDQEKYFVTHVGSSLTTEIIRCARQGNPWTFKKYFEHVREIESPFECTVGDYHIATGGIDKTVCFRRLAGQLISGAITDHHGCKRQYENNPSELHAREAKKRKKISNSRTENTICGSEAVFRQI